MEKTASTIDDIRIELMTTLEVRQHLEAGCTTIVVPCGAIEQHGPHLPICMDRDHAEHLGALLALRLGNALVAPTLPVGCSAHHLSFAGTISIREEAFEAICCDYCTSLAGHGFERIIFISGHIGNFPVLARILPTLKAAVGEGCEIEAFTDPTAWLETWRSAVIAAGGNLTAVGGHADIAETSIMLVLRPDRTHLDRAVAGLIGLMSRDELNTVWRDGLGSVSPNGILGDARGSTAAIGERCIDAITDLLARQFARDA
jgi:creatinine amidohydrolase